MAGSTKTAPPQRNRVPDSSDGEAGPSRISSQNPGVHDIFSDPIGGDVDEEGEAEDNPDGFRDGMVLEGFSGPKEKVVKPLTPEALAAFKAAKERTGVVYISRIPPGMRPTKVRHLMSQYGEIGKVYLQQEGAESSFRYHSVFVLTRKSDAKTAYLRRKYTSTKKPHFTEGWVEFKDKRVARSVAAMLNATSIGGKKGTRFRDDVWTMKYLPKFKWDMLTEQIGKVLSLCSLLSLAIDDPGSTRGSDTPSQAAR